MSDNTIELRGYTWVRVDPLKIDPRDDRSDIEFTFDRVYPSDVPEDLSVPSGASMSKPKPDLVGYQYGESEPILVGQNGPYARKGHTNSEARNQAFFIMSILDSNGYVGRWRKR